MQKRKQVSRLLALFILFLLVLACNLPTGGRVEQVTREGDVPGQALTNTAPMPPAPTEQPAATTTYTATIPPHQATPSAPSGKPSVIADQESIGTAPQGRAYGGDDYYNGRLERPFTDLMHYQVYLDIVNAGLVFNPPFFYFSLRLEGSPNKFEGQPPVYGFEIDTDIDGRGDFLLAASPPFTTEWSQEGVRVWEDANGDVGGQTPVRADPPFGSGDGYEKLVFEPGAVGENPDLLWVRLDPVNPVIIQFALHRSLFTGQLAFAWGAYADGFLRKPEGFDFNDRFTQEEAGSAQKEPHFPLKAFHSFDNTCRTTYGTAPAGQPGICPVYIPPTQTGLPPATPTPVPPGIVIPLLP